VGGGEPHQLQRQSIPPPTRRRGRAGADDGEGRFQTTSPAPYTAPNQLYFNTFDAIKNCAKSNTVVVQDDHLFASPLIGFVNAADNPCGTGRGKCGQRAGQAGCAHLSTPRRPSGICIRGRRKWWIVQVGAISGKFENRVNITPPKAMCFMPRDEAGTDGGGSAIGASVRLALGGYELINMNNTSGATGIEAGCGDMVWVAWPLACVAASSPSRMSPVMLMAWRPLEAPSLTCPVRHGDAGFGGFKPHAKARVRFNT